MADEELVDTLADCANMLAEAQAALTDCRNALAAIRATPADAEPVAWFNECDRMAVAALRFLSDNPRPIGGEQAFNWELYR